MAKPFLKWAGGKRQLLPEILARAPAAMATYFEPFLGGGAVFFALQSEGRFRRALLADRSFQVVQAYRTVKASPERVALGLQRRVRSFLELGEEDRGKAYYAARDEVPEDPIEAAALFLFLNRTCFNGLHRVNRSGRFNVPYGRYVSPTFPTLAHLQETSLALRFAEIRGPLDFTEASAQAAPGDFIYFDPPYAPFSHTARFTDYTAGGFGWEGQLRLAAECRRLTEAGVEFLLSNSSGTAVGELYSREGFLVETVHARRAINSAGMGRGLVPEFLISNKPLL